MTAGFPTEEIYETIARVRRRLGGTAEAPPEQPRVPVEVPPAELGEGIHATVEEAVAAADRAGEAYQRLGSEIRVAVVASIRKAMVANARRLAAMAHEETGLGRVEDKVRKNLLVATRTPGPEDLAAIIETGDDGMMLTEMAPMGLVASITPSTNPTATIINNTIAVLSGGNPLVFNAHPSARGVSAECVRLLGRSLRWPGPPSRAPRP
jgi:aldehyde dehydrogenase